MTPSSTAATARVLLLVDAVDRAGGRRVSDLDLTRLAYFVDAFSPLWGLSPLDRYRAKVEDVRSDDVRRALNRLVVCGVIEPSEIAVLHEPRPHLSARYRVVAERGVPILRAIQATYAGRRETGLVAEVVYAAAALLDGNLAEAVRQDAAYSDPRIGPADVIDLANPEAGTAEVARRFRPGVSSAALVEAELTHLYMAHLERVVARG